jgi:protoporphyrinogen/coproporphyrinogen III oxidase
MQSLEMPARIAIVGGGISGLAAAHYLARHRPDLHVVVIERDHRLGGKIVTEQFKGFVVEGGPDSFLSSKPRGLGLARELGLEGRLQGTNDSKRRTWVMSQGRLHRLPEGLSGLVPSRLEPLLESDLFSPAGKERLLREPEIPARDGNDDESIAAFISRRFGSEVYERMVEPLMAGIYAGNGEHLSLAATFPQLRQLEQQYGSLLAGIQATTASSGTQPSRSAFLTPCGGTGELVVALSRSMPEVEVVTNMGVRIVEEVGGGFVLRLEDDSTLRTDVVILATPAHETSTLVAHLDGTLSETLGSIPHVSSATVSLAYPAGKVSRALEGYGYVVPRREGRPVLASTWTSTKFAHRAPEGWVLLRVFIGRSGVDEVLKGSDASLAALARAEVADVLECRDEPGLQRVFRWVDGMPQYTMGHLDRVVRVRVRSAHHPGLFLAGNYLQGVGLPDCIASGEQAGKAASNYVGTGTLQASGRDHDTR